MNRNFASFALACVLLSLSACYENIEGCLDIEAVNFNPEADRNCCCEYPVVSARFEPILGADRAWTPNARLTNNLGQEMHLLSVDFFVHDLFATDEKGVVFRPTDRMMLELTDQGQIVKEEFSNDFGRIGWPPANLTLGRFEATGEFVELGLRLGLSQRAELARPVTQPANHPLGPAAVAMMYDSSRAAFWSGLVRFSAPGPDSAVHELRFTSADLGGATVSGVGPFKKAAGRNLSIRIQGRYDLLMRDIDLLTGDISIWKQQMAHNLKEVFIVLPE